MRAGRARDSRRHFATYFDRHYLSRGLALYESLRLHSPGFTLWVLCLDETTELVLRALALPSVELFTLKALENELPALLAVKPERTFLEYYWTLTAAWTLHVMESHPGIDLLTYVDADNFFYADPSPVYEG
jgi:hypothetical protein